MARTLSYQVGVLTLGRLVAYLVMFFVPLVNVRALSIHDYGVYRQFWLLFETISALLIFSFPQSILYYLPRAEDKKEKTIYVTQTVAFLTVMGLLSWVVFFVLRMVLGEGLGSVVRQFFWRFCFFSLFMIVARIMDYLFAAEKQVERQSIFQASSSFFRSAVVISVSWYTRSVDMLIWAICGFSIILVVFTLAYISLVYRAAISFTSVRHIREQLSYALPLGLAAVVLLLFTQTDKYIITHYMGSAAFAIYSVGAFQIPLVNIVINSVSNVTLPLMAQYQKEGRYADIVDLWRRMTLKTAVLFFPFFVFLEVSAKQVITLLFTDKYVGATFVFLIYLFLFLRATVETWGILVVFKKNSFLFKVFSLGLVLNLILSIFLYKKIGRLGVPLATVVVSYLVHTINIFRASRILRVGFASILPWAKLGKRFLIALVPGVLIFWINSVYKIDTLTEVLLSGISYFAVYILLILGFHIVSWRDIKSVFGRV